MNKDTDWGLIKRWLDGDRSEESQKQVESWLNADSSNQELLAELEDRWEQQTTEEFDSIQAYTEVKEKMEQESRKTPVREIYPTRRKRSWIRIAATVMLIAAAGFMAFWLTDSEPADIAHKYVISQTLTGQTAKVNLPDGSVAYLNAGSSLKYAETFGTDTREVILTGEAFFEVTRDTLHPFLVKTGDVTTQVLGTSFNVRAYENPEVTVATGKVSVSINGTNERVFLNPGQQATRNLETGSLETREVNPILYTSWKDEVLVFDEFSLAEAAIMLERKYHVSIDIQNRSLADCVMVGQHQNKSLENLLLAMQYVLEFEYEFTSPKAVTITGKGCQE